MSQQTMRVLVALALVLSASLVATQEESSAVSGASLQPSGSQQYPSGSSQGGSGAYTQAPLATTASSSNYPESVKKAIGIFKNVWCYISTVVMKIVDIFKFIFGFGSDSKEDKDKETKQDRVYEESENDSAYERALRSVGLNGTTLASQLTTAVYGTTLASQLTTAVYGMTTKSNATEPAEVPEYKKRVYEQVGTVIQALKQIAIILINKASEVINEWLKEVTGKYEQSSSNSTNSSSQEAQKMGEKVSRNFQRSLVSLLGAE